MSKSTQSLRSDRAVSADSEPATTAAIEDTLVPTEKELVEEREQDFPSISPDHYEVGEEFARGGLGRILRARDRRLQRSVALKELISKKSRAEARFVREAMITARLEHPNIVTVHEAGRWPNGTRFYAMKLVEGQTLHEALEQAIDPSERLTLLNHVIDVADAVAYAHSEGILHRDLKPANVMVGPFGETVVIDWGLAKSRHEAPARPAQSSDTSKPGVTADGIVVGTPAYMSPEQARAESLDERTDVYAIGTLLYEVLCGRRPYEDVEPHRVLEAVVAGPPRRVEALAPQMPVELIAIVNKAMARDKEARYPSARELAGELRRFTAGKLVEAHDYSALEMIRRFVRRQRAAFYTGTLALLALIVLGAVSVHNIREERNQARANAALAKAQVDRVLLAQARAALDEDPTRSLAWLKKTSRYVPGAASVAATARSLGTAKHELRGHTAEVRAVAVGRRFIASGSDDATVRLWSIKSGSSRKLVGHDARVSALAFSGDDRQLISAGHDGQVRVWSIDDGRSRSLKGHEGAVVSVAYSPDGERFATMGRDGRVLLWTKGGEIERTIEVGVVNRHCTLSFSGDGRWLLSGGHKEEAFLWAIGASKKERFSVEGAQVQRAALSKSGRYVALASANAIKLFDRKTGKQRALLGHRDRIEALVFSADSRRLASAGLDHEVRVWDLKSGASKAYVGHRERVVALAFSPDGARLASGSWDKSLRVWELSGGGVRRLLGHRDLVSHVVFDAFGTLISGSWDKSLRVWGKGAQTPRILEGHKIGVHGVDFSPDGRTLVSGGHDNVVKRWELSTGLATDLAVHEDHIYRVRFSPDGRWVASSSDDRTVRLWSLDEGTERVLEGHKADVEELVFSKDGRFLASAGEDNAVWLWPVWGGKGRALKGHSGHVTDLAFLTKSGMLASGSRDQTVRIWSLQSGEARVLRGHGGEVWSVDVSPDESTVASASADGTVRLWDVKTGKERAKMRIEDARLLRFAPQGASLVVAGGDGALWTCGPGSPCRQLHAGGGAILWDMVFSPKGRALVTGGGDGEVRVWDLQTGEHLALLGHRAAVFDVAVSSDGKHIASASGDQDVRVWRLELPPKPRELEDWLLEQTSATVSDF